MNDKKSDRNRLVQHQFSEEKIHLFYRIIKVHFSGALLTVYNDMYLRRQRIHWMDNFCQFPDGKHKKDQWTHVVPAVLVSFCAGSNLRWRGPYDIKGLTYWVPFSRGIPDSRIVLFIRVIVHSFQKMTKKSLTERATIQYFVWFQI